NTLARPFQTSLGRTDCSRRFSLNEHALALGEQTSERARCGALAPFRWTSVLEFASRSHDCVHLVGLLTWSPAPAGAPAFSAFACRPPGNSIGSSWPLTSTLASGDLITPGRLRSAPAPGQRLRLQGCRPGGQVGKHLCQ